MNTISQYLPSTATVEDARQLLDNRPDLYAYFERLRHDRSNKTKFRAPLERIYSPEVVGFLLPKLTGGRVAYEGVFPLLTSTARTAIVNALGTPISEVVWTPETASQAANAIVATYPNATSAAMSLKYLRASIGEALGLDAAAAKLDPTILATRRLEVTTIHNKNGALRLEARIAAGIAIPPLYERLALLEERARAFIAAPAATAQAAADLLVIFSARPGEAETLRVGTQGGLVGVLKKRGMDADTQYNIVSALSEPLAVSYLEAWRGLSPTDKRAAMAALTRLAATWGLQRRDLRAVGAALALRHELLAGSVHNAAEGRAAHAAALRHAIPDRAPAQQHYERVADPTAKLAAEIAELPADAMAAVLALIASMKVSAK
jgi:hypothetical protein